MKRLLWAKLLLIVVGNNILYFKKSCINEAKVKLEKQTKIKNRE
jgi:hypothetical protein